MEGGYIMVLIMLRGLGSKMQIDVALFNKTRSRKL